MKIGRRLMEEEEKGAVAGREDEKGSSEMGCRKMRRRTSRPLVQEVFDLCKDVFGGPGSVPSPADVQRMRLILDRMKPADIGLSEDFFFYNSRAVTVNETPRMRYMHIDECGKLFSIGVFLLPESATIPLHDHPGMTVFTKLLFGSVRLRSYDWVEPFEPEEELPPHVRLAKLKVDSVFTAPCNSFVLYPASGGNLHCLQAVQPCAVLDVLGPPYSVEDGRDSTYYQELPYSSYPGAAYVREDETDQYRWLEKIEPPNLQVGPADYTGPEIVKAF